jgi:hypothetical protein
MMVCSSKVVPALAMIGVHVYENVTSNLFVVAVGCAKAGLPTGIIENEADVYDPGYVVHMKCPNGMELQSGSTAPVEWKCGDDNQWTRLGAKDPCINPGR